MATDWLKSQVFPGESGGDYNALFGYSNRPGGQFAGVNLTDMTVDQALQFANPSGPYGQWVKGQVGRVATPMGAYQVVGTTLRAAKEGLGLTGNERMTPETQDRIGQWIYQTQGPGAWEAWGKGGGNMGAGGRPQPTMATQGQPQQERLPFRERLRQAAQSGQLMDNAAMAFNSLRMRPDPDISQMAMQREQTRQEQARANRTAVALERMGRPDLARMVSEGAIDGKSALGIALSPAKDDRTALIKNYEFAVENGFDGSFQDFLAKGGGGGVSVNMPQVGTIPQGYELFQDKQSGSWAMRPISGGPEDTSESDANRAENEAAGAVNVLGVVRDLKKAVSENPGMTTGLVGSILQSIPATGAYDAQATSQTIKANLAFDALAAMRKASPTGGALGAVSERELGLLESQIANLDLGQSPGRVLESLERIESQYVRILRKAYETGDPEALDAALGGRPDFLIGGPDNAPSDDGIPTWNPQTKAWE